MNEGARHCDCLFATSPAPTSPSRGERGRKWARRSSALQTGCQAFFFGPDLNPFPGLSRQSAPHCPRGPNSYGGRKASLPPAPFGFCWSQAYAEKGLDVQIFLTLVGTKIWGALKTFQRLGSQPLCPGSFQPNLGYCLSLPIGQIKRLHYFLGRYFAKLRIRPLCGKPNLCDNMNCKCVDAVSGVEMCPEGQDPFPTSE